MGERKWDGERRDSTAAVLECNAKSMYINAVNADKYKHFADVVVCRFSAGLRHSGGKVVALHEDRRFFRLWCVRR